MKKLLALLFAFAMLLTLVACSGAASESSVVSESQSSPKSESSSEAESSESESTPAEVGRWDALQTTDEEFTLYVDFHSNTPSVNEEPTEENPKVFNSSRTIANAWLEDKPNVSIEWTRGKTMGDYQTMLEWLTIQMNAATCPDILFAWGSTYAKNGWYITLNDVVESPNYYEPGNTCWKDMYPEYLWKDSMHIDANGDIIAIPSTVYPGPPTVYYYNTEIFDEFGLEPTTDWQTFIDMMQPVKAAGYTAFAPASFPDNGTWDIQFSLGPYYAISFADEWDLDGDSVQSARENVYSTYQGTWYMEKNPAIFEMWKCVKDKFTLLCDDGYENIDYWQPWRDGTVAIKEGGIWDFPTHMSDTERPFDFDMMAPPVIQTSEYVKPISFTEAGPYMPQPMEAYNVMKAEVQDRPTYHEDYAIDFLKYTHTTANFSMIVEERAGNGIGAMKGCAVPASLQEWVSRSFPEKPTCSPCTAFTADGNSQQTKLIQMWVKDMVTDEEFQAEYDTILYNDLMAYIDAQAVELDDSWVEYVPTVVG